jgi:hypothetical protein
MECRFFDRDPLRSRQAEARAMGFFSARMGPSFGMELGRVMPGVPRRALGAGSKGVSSSSHIRNRLGVSRSRSSHVIVMNSCCDRGRTPGRIDEPTTYE